MISQLANTFKDSFTTIYNPSITSYKWFKTNEEEVFGIKNTICPQQLALLTQLFEPFQPAETQAVLHTVQQKWYDFLFNQSNDLPFEQQTVIRFYYIRSPQPIDTLNIIEEAFNGIFEHTTFLMLHANEGLIIEEQAQPESPKLFIDALQSLTEDMLLAFQSTIGQIHQTDLQLPKQFNAEYQFFRNLSVDSTQMVTAFHEAFIRSCPTTNLAPDLLSKPLREILQQTETTQMITVFCRCNLNVSLAAKKLFVHRNSLQYRIERLFQLTGIDIRDFSQAMFLILAIQLIKN